MKLNAYTVYDSKAELYLPPQYYISKGMALRAFEEAANDPQSSIGKYPNDFTMFEIGIFDQEKATLIQHTAKVSLGTANEYVRKGN